MTVKMRVVDEKQKKGNVSRWHSVYTQLLSIPAGKTLEVNLSSYVESEKLKNAVYTYAKRKGFKVSICYGVGSPTNAVLYIERIDDDNP